MTDNWNTLAALPKRTNDFGQPLLDDYGQDDLSPMLAMTYGEVDPTTLDRLDAQVDSILGDDLTVPERMPLLTALITPDMPASVVPVPVPAVDFVEDGVAWWIGPDAAIGVETKMIDAVGDLAERGNWLARQGYNPTEFGIVVQPHGDVEPTGPTTKHKVEYGLWAMVRDALLVDA